MGRQLSRRRSGNPGVISYLGLEVFCRRGRVRGRIVGITRRPCFDGCGGLRLAVRWKDGKITYPCTKGMGITKDGSLKIG